MTKVLIKFFKFTKLPHKPKKKTKYAFKKTTKNDQNTPET